MKDWSRLKRMLQEMIDVAVKRIEPPDMKQVNVSGMSQPEVLLSCAAILTWLADRTPRSDEYRANLNMRPAVRAACEKLLQQDALLASMFEVAGGRLGYAAGGVDAEARRQMQTYIQRHYHPPVDV